MKAELGYLVACCILSLIMWLPYILARISAWGLIEAMGYPAKELPQPEWALRLQKAHRNLTENLVPFAGLVIAAEISGLTNDMTALGAMIFFWSRVIYTIVYAIGVPILRTLMFAIGLVGCLMVASAFI
ncbi:MAG: MAPEG family protein [Rhodospirillales bacterium]|jgi:uncharacterized MAPEG superfamily protein